MASVSCNCVSACHCCRRHSTNMPAAVQGGCTAMIQRKIPWYATVQHNVEYRIHWFIDTEYIGLLQYTTCCYDSVQHTDSDSAYQIRWCVSTHNAVHDTAKSDYYGYGTRYAPGASSRQASLRRREQLCQTCHRPHLLTDKQ